MAFPTIAPTSRQYGGGDWPVKAFQAQSGAEVRILYGNKRFGHTLSLTYENISDTVAESFFTHYYEQQGTYKTFAVPVQQSVRRGWSGSDTFFNAGVGIQWRYASPPQLTSVRPGISSVRIELVGSLLAVIP